MTSPLPSSGQTLPNGLSPNQMTDPLAQLRDIHLPDPVGWWPPAPGWWVLALLALAAIGYTLVYFYRRRQTNIYRRQALAELEGFYRAKDNAPKVFCQQALALIRRTVKTAYPSSYLAAAPTAELLTAINTEPHEHGFNTQLRQQLQDLPYRKEPDFPENLCEELYRATKQWLQKHPEKCMQENSAC